MDVTMTPEQRPRSSPRSLPSSSPSTSTSSPVGASGLSGLVIPPFPKRELRPNTSMRTFKNTMNEQEANEMKNQVFQQLEEFDNEPPFTIQRLCELCLEPKRHYKSIGKYLRALEKTILVTSSRDMYSEELKADFIAPGGGFGDRDSLRLTMTPVFSPISFLHDDARRSRSPSPFELAVTRHPEEASTPVEPPSGRKVGIGMVDELDDPSPGHLADHPKALTTATSTSLSDRFVKSSSPDMTSDVLMKDSSTEDAEVEGMVLDDNPAEDEDKENKPS